MGDMFRKIAIVIFLSFWFTISNAAEFTGTYGGLEYHDESGDLSGLELKFIYSNDGYYLLFQSASGVPSTPVLMKVTIDDGSFVVKIPEGTNYGGAILKGQFSKEGIHAEFTNGPIFSNGEKRNFLRRTKSYWD